MSNRKQRDVNRANAGALRKPTICPNCGRPGRHFCPPGFGEEGFYACETINAIPVADAVNHSPALLNLAKLLGYPDFNEDGHALAAGPFKCPECGGSTFGSSICKDGKVEKGYCHDAHGVSCRFQWDRANDRQYFSATTAEIDRKAMP